METTSSPMPKSSGWKVMGIISLILGILSILFAFIPCLGAYAMYSGVLAAVLSVIALVMANSAKASKGMAIGALVVSLASIGVGYWRYTQVKSAVETLKNDVNKINDSLNKK